MAVTGIRGVVEAAIHRASNATGVDFGFLMGTAKRESGGNPTARAGTSSASGLFQFIDQTWLSTLKQHGAKYGYARYAELIRQGSDGRYSVAGDEARKAVMSLKLDPHAASLMAGELTSDHAGLSARPYRTPADPPASSTPPISSARRVRPDSSRAWPTVPAPPPPACFQTPPRPTAQSSIAMAARRRWARSTPT